MRTLPHPLVLAVLLALVAGSARGAVATGEAPPRGEPSADLLVLLLAPPRAESGAHLAAGPDGSQGAREASKERASLPVLAFLVLEPGDRGELAWIPERRVAGSALFGAFPTGADPPETRTPSDARAHGYGEVHQAAGSQGLWREGLGSDIDLLGAQFRHARPGLGRWARRDPGGLIDGPNRYRWNRNNPNRWVDRTGLAGETPFDVAVFLTDISLVLYHRYREATAGTSAERVYHRMQGDTWTAAAGADAAAIAVPTLPGGYGFAGATGARAGAAVGTRAVPAGAGALTGLAGQVCLFNEGQGGGGGAGSRGSGPRHHIATNKNRLSSARGGPWTPRFEKLFEKVGMSLDDVLNTVRVPGHRGPHPEAYHQAVFDRLRKALRGRSGPQAREVFEQELRDLATEASTPGSPLNRLLTGQ